MKPAIRGAVVLLALVGSAGPVRASRGSHWVLVRVDRDGAAREVARIARRCAL